MHALGEIDVESDNGNRHKHDEEKDTDFLDKDFLPSSPAQRIVGVEIQGKEEHEHGNDDLDIT